MRVHTHTHTYMIALRACIGESETACGHVQFANNNLEAFKLSLQKALRIICGNCLSCFSAALGCIESSFRSGEP